jgi:hypothetical protein
MGSVRLQDVPAGADPTGSRIIFAMSLHTHSMSSSAKADDPVFQNSSDGVEKPQRTGYPLSAGMTASL